MPQPQFPPSILQQYTVHNLLGQGGFASVYKATNILTEQIVALKLIDKNKLIHKQRNPERKQLKLKYLKTQGQIMMKCDSDHILKCYNIIEDDNTKVMVLEYCSDGSLLDKIEKQNKIPEKECIDILDQLLYGFGELHKNKIVHRDLKTENILIHGDIYKIADLGLAKQVQRLNNSIRGTTVGTRCTMAPEVLRDEEYGFQADMWSLGVIFYEMVTGRLPYYQMVNENVVVKVIDSIEKMEGVSDASKDLMKMMFKINPRERLRWVDLYRMKNNCTGIFQDNRRHSFARSRTEEELLDIYNSQKYKKNQENKQQVQKDKIQEKGIEINIQQTKKSNPENSSQQKTRQNTPTTCQFNKAAAKRECDQYKNLEDDFTTKTSDQFDMIIVLTNINIERHVFYENIQQIDLTIAKVKRIQRNILKHYWNSQNNTITINSSCPKILKNQFLQMIISQCIKLIQQHEDYLDLDQDSRPGKFSSTSKINKSVEELNKLGKSLYDIKNKLFIQYLTLNQGFPKKVKRKFDELRSSVITQNELLNYTLYQCTQDEHIKKTKEIYDKILQFNRSFWDFCCIHEDPQEEFFKKYYKPTLKADSIGQISSKKYSPVSQLQCSMSINEE